MNNASTKIADAFKNNRPLKMGEANTDGRTVYYRGDAIARNFDRSGLEISLAGWPTPTTRRHLNAVLNAFHSTRGLAQVAGKQVLFSIDNQPEVPMPANEWVKIPD